MDPVALAVGGGALILAPAAKDLLVRLVGPSVDVYGNDLRDCMLGRRAKNLEDVATKAAAQASSEEASCQALLATIVPLLEGASLADSAGGLQDRWAGLLASTVAGVNVPPSYPRILSELTSRDAALLDVLDRTCRLPESAPPLLGRVGRSDGLSDAELLESADNLIRLRLCVIVVPQSGEVMKRVHLALSPDSALEVTTLGAAFLRACRGPG